MKNIQKLKNEKGSVSVYVLIAMLILIMILIEKYIYHSQQYAQSLDVTEHIKGVYEQNMNNIQDVYNSISNK